MPRAKPMTVRLSAREAVAAGRRFSPYGDELHDPDVALDWILSLAPPREPVVIRAEAEGGRSSDRARVAGDWLCGPGLAQPVRLPMPVWVYSGDSLRWSRGRRWVEAWEECDDARWMVAAALTVPVPRRAVLDAACRCARSVLNLADATDRRPMLALSAAYGVARGATRAAQVSGAMDGASFSAYEAAARGYAAASNAAGAAWSAAAFACYVAAPDAYAGYVGAAAAAADMASLAAAASARLGPDGAEEQRLAHLRYMARKVREAISTADVLIAAAAA